MMRTLGSAVWPLGLSESHRVISHFPMPSRDRQVESALNLALITIPAASAVPFLPIPALVEWTRSDITEGDLMEYAVQHVSGTSSEERQSGAWPCSGWTTRASTIWPATASSCSFRPAARSRSATPRSDPASTSSSGSWCVDEHELSS